MALQIKVRPSLSDPLLQLAAARLHTRLSGAGRAVFDTRSVCDMQGLEDVSILASASNMANLNVSFNKLVSLNGLEALSLLQLLDLSHNKVKSLKPLGSLSGLQVLKASHNNISQLVPLSSCSSLRELWLQHNQLAALSSLAPLSALPWLTTIFLSPNPLCVDLKTDYRAAVVHTLPSVQVLDGQAVSGDRTPAADYSTRQAAQQAIDAAAAQESKDSLATSQKSKSGGLQPGLPGSPQRGLSKSKSTSLKHRKSRDVGGATNARPEETSNVVKSDEVTGFGQVTLQLPKFDIDKHGNRLDKPLDPYGTTTLKRTSTRQDAGPIETVYQTFYGHTNQHQAVIVRSDGSAAAQYPSDSLAVSVDPEQTGGRRGGMRLLATYRSTGLAAVIFEADGTGSVQYPNGNLWMTYTAETGKGALYSHTGEVTRTWSSETEEPIELLLDQHLGFCYNHRQPVVYFACEGQTQCFKQGQNPAEHVWDQSSESPAPAFLQAMVDNNRSTAPSLVSAEPGSIPRGTAAQPVAGPSLDQLTAITAALTALQSSMTNLLVPSDSEHEGPS